MDQYCVCYEDISKYIMFVYLVTWDKPSEGINEQVSPDAGSFFFSLLSLSLPLFSSLITTQLNYSELVYKHPA